MTADDDGITRSCCGCAFVEHDLARLATLEAPFHRAHHQNESPGLPLGP
jgi:hypothetical protein